MEKKLLPTGGLAFLCAAFFCNVLLVQSVFGQQALPKLKKAVLKPGTTLGQQPPGRHSRAGSNAKSLGDTSAVLDYSSYNAITAMQQGLNYYGDLNAQSPQIYVEGITSFVNQTTMNAMDFTYAQVAYDSLAFSNYNAQSTYSLPRAGSSITLDSVGMYLSIYGDTVSADGLMAHDSVVLDIYRIIGHTVSATPAITVVKTGYAELSPFFTDSDQITYAAVPVGYQFNPDESFAVKFRYLNKDPSSHCNMVFSFADSCGFPYGSTAAYPSPFAQSSSMGIIDSTGPTTDSILNVTNQYLYTIPNTPLNCSYIYWQNWDILSFVSINVPYSAHIQASQPAICGSATVGLYAQVFGTDSPTITYTWSVNGGGALQNTDAQSTSLNIPANVTSNVTVTLAVNNSNSTVADSVVLINCHLNVNAGYNQTVCSGSNIILTPNATGGTPPYTYQWQSTGSSLSCNNCENPILTLSQNSVYTITVTDAVQATATSSVWYNLNGSTNQVQFSVANSGIACSGQWDTTTVTVTGGTAPYSINWGGGNLTSGNSIQTYNYAAPGGQQIIAVTDAGGCVTAAFDTVQNVGPSAQILGGVIPNCPNAYTGEIIALITGGIQPYTNVWYLNGVSANQNSLSLDTLKNAESGQYQLVVTDAHFCTTELDYALNPGRDYGYYVYLSTTNANCNFNGLVRSAVSGGVSPYNYLWSNSATTTNIQPTTPGTYSLTVTDSLGCQTFGNTQISNLCQSVISGRVFYDTLGNCNAQTGLAAQWMYIEASSSNGDQQFGFTDNDGYYAIYLNDTGTYTLNAFNYYSSNCVSLTFCGNTNQTVYLPVLGDTSNNNNIGLSTGTGFDLGIHPGWTSADPGFVKQYWVFYYNSSYTPFNGTATVTFVYDSNLVYLYSDETPAPVNDVATHTLTWTVNGLSSIYTYDWSQLDAYFQVPDSLSLNYQLKSDFTMLPKTGDCDTSDNHYHYSEIVIGSHDPNEKTVEPAGPVTEDDSVLTYTIHFQNTGTDSTHFVVIKDTLSRYLDPTSVRNIASSDKYSAFNVSGNGVLTWTFNPLRIVDSATNPTGSKRFIMFTVKKKANLPIGTTVSNTAFVYFDYNSAVVTNTVVDTVALPTAIVQVNNTTTQISVRAFPNPFNDFTNILVTGLKEKFSFELYDVTGRLQQSIPSVDNNQFEVDRGILAKGVYLYRIIVAGKPAAYGKLVVE